MNTPIFYILQGIFILLYVREFALWSRTRKSEAYAEAQKRGVYRYVSLIAMAIAAALSVGAFVAEAPCRFRLTLMAFLIAPVVVIHIKSLHLERSKREKIISALVYATYIPMCMIYLQ